MSRPRLREGVPDATRATRGTASHHTLLGRVFFIKLWPPGDGTVRRSSSRPEVAWVCCGHLPHRLPESGGGAICGGLPGWLIRGPSEPRTARCFSLDGRPGDGAAWTSEATEATRSLLLCRSTVWLRSSLRWRRGRAAHRTLARLIRLQNGQHTKKTQKRMRGRARTETANPCDSSDNSNMFFQYRANSGHRTITKVWEAVAQWGECHVQ